MSRNERKYRIGYLEDSKGRRKSDSFYLFWSEGGRSRRCSTGTDDRQEAETFLAHFILEREAPAIRKRDQMPLAVVFEDYIREHGPNIVNLKRTKLSRDRVLEYFYDETVAAISTNSIRGFIQWRRDAGLKDSSIRRELNDLRAALNHQEIEGRLESAPRFRNVEDGPGREQYLTQQQAAALYDAIDLPHIQLAMDIALRTGQRKGAILELTWEQVNFEERLIHFNPAGRKQTDKRRAIVPMSDQMFVILWSEASHARSRQEMVVQGRYGAIHGGSMLKGFNQARERIGMGKETTFHVLRHTVATWLIMQGVDKDKVKTLLAHNGAAKKDMTDRYIHLNPDYLRDVVSVLDRFCAPFARKDVKLTVNDRRRQYA